MDGSTLTYGFVGAGFIARFQLAALRQLRGIEVAGVTAVNGAPEFARLAADAGLGATKVFESVGATIQQSLLIVAAMAAALFVIALFLGVGARPAGASRPAR